MIPASPYATGSRAEKVVFDRLRSAFEGPGETGYTAFHSINIKRHARKRFGEIDFLVLCPEGIYVLEVKGGRLGCKEGVWSSTDKLGKTHDLRESPFRQAESALHGLMQDLREKLPASVLANITIGYGVILPDCHLGTVGSEWDAHVVFDQGWRKGFDLWLKSLFSYWRKKGSAKSHISPDSLKEIARYLRPEFESIEPLYAQAESIESTIESLTKDQMKVVDIVSANDRVLCAGGAGTGKTFLAVELARRWVGEGLSVALVCRSPWLRNYLAGQFPMDGLSIATIEGLPAQARRAGVEFYDAMIVDEGQDLLYMECLDVLDRHLRGGLGEGRWCFFHDCNNQSGFFGDIDRAAYDYMYSLGASKVPLSTNCRNTKIILERIKADIGADMGVNGAGEGPKIREQVARSLAQAEEILHAELDWLINNGGLLPSQITILVGSDIEESFLQEMRPTLREEITVMDEYMMHSFPPKKISFCKISDFKGLENDAIVLLGVSKPDKSSGKVLEHYVGMSRAKAILSLVYLSP